MAATAPADFRRFTEFQTKLTKLREWSTGFLSRHNGAVRVNAAGNRRCIGVTTLLTNYYIPNLEDSKAIVEARDRGKELAFVSSKPNIDKDTYSARFVQLGENDYESFDEGLCVGSHLSKVGITLMGFQEFMVGSQRLVAREHPRSDAEFSYLVGAIDEIGYNNRTAKLVLLENKQSHSTAKYIALKTLFLKEKHSKQLSCYALMFLFMCQEAGVDIREEDIELVIVGHAKGKRKVGSWRFGFDRTTFLGEHWAAQRWHPLLCADTSRNAIQRLEQQVPTPRCSVCNSVGTLRQDGLRFYCSEYCWNQRPRCVSCGQTATYFSQQYNINVCQAHANLST